MDVGVGDRLEIGFGQRMVTAEIRAIKENVRADEADSLYKLLEGSPIE
jgi:ribosomal 50S subunit-recycling heat shock protein